MAITTTTHLNFRGDAPAALGFYQSVFGGHLSVVAYGDFSMPKELPDADKVVLGQVKADNDAATASQRWLAWTRAFNTLMVREVANSALYPARVGRSDSVTWFKPLLRAKDALSRAEVVRGTRRLGQVRARLTARPG